jgi:hypothetical protein
MHQLQHCGKAISAPADALSISEVLLPHLIYSYGGLLKLIRSLHQDIEWTGNQIQHLSAAKHLMCHPPGPRSLLRTIRR